MDLDDSILQVAKTWMKKQSTLSTSAKQIRKEPPKSREFLESNLIQKINPCSTTASFCAIDGGIVCEEFHGLDVAISRSVSSCFWYKNSDLSSAKYYPNSNPHYRIDAHSSLGQFEKMRFLSLIRLQSELQCAIGSLNKFSPNYILLDGSIAPLTDDKPPSDSPLYELYNKIISNYKSLYSQCESKNCSLVGVTKDSRSRRLVEILSSSNPHSTQDFSSCDTVFLNHLLEGGERTSAFRYSNSHKKNHILGDLGEYSQKILAFYLKPVKNDRPLRVEFLSNNQSFSKIADTISNLSALNSNYAYPAVLIEADLRAALQSTEIESAIQTLATKVGYKNPILKLRRNDRPFR